MPLSQLPISNSVSCPRHTKQEEYGMCDGDSHFAAETIYFHDRYYHGDCFWQEQLQLDANSENAKLLGVDLARPEGENTQLWFVRKREVVLLPLKCASQEERALVLKVQENERRAVVNDFVQNTICDDLAFLAPYGRPPLHQLLDTLLLEIKKAAKAEPHLSASEPARQFAARWFPAEANLRVLRNFGKLFAEELRAN